ncbi:hypothetical protein DAEQUDRAFT_216867 [Daedalea quercina L-15889]|uniref:Uncharacterized protein n=1 Tax=Daedalea quercina L-15889 TaxID=1314783 RepID=A0A165R4S7_9APHY|nr:hypothetical protein DAEQUDRAFT_216867 [Daedalea quercina L-15889]
MVCIPSNLAVIFVGIYGRFRTMTHRKRSVLAACSAFIGLTSPTRVISGEHRRSPVLRCILWNVSPMFAGLQESIVAAFEFYPDRRYYSSHSDKYSLSSGTNTKPPLRLLLFPSCRSAFSFFAAYTCASWIGYVNHLTPCPRPSGSLELFGSVPVGVPGYHDRPVPSKRLSTANDSAVYAANSPVAVLARYLSPTRPQCTHAVYVSRLCPT